MHVARHLSSFFFLSFISLVPGTTVWPVAWFLKKPMKLPGAQGGGNGQTSDLHVLRLQMFRCDLPPCKD